MLMLVLLNVSDNSRWLCGGLFFMFWYLAQGISIKNYLKILIYLQMPKWIWTKPNKPKQSQDLFIQFSVGKKSCFNIFNCCCNWGWLQCSKQKISANLWMLNFWFWKCEDPVVDEYCYNYAHFVMQSELPDLVLHFCVLYFFSIVFKTRKSVEEYKTGHRHSCEGQLEASHWSHCSLLCCNWLFRNENGEAGMRRQTPLDGSTVF